MRLRRTYDESAAQRRRNLLLWNSTGVLNAGSRIKYARLTESLAFRALESGDIRLLEFTAPAIAPVVGGRIGIDFTIGTSALA
jgi:hypothetical protein